jgi:protein-S-isoprenylcysteine O-methyltransferase Ste14
LLSFIGFGIALNNWISLILVTSAITAAFIMRIRIEEKTLIEQFGTEYIEYKKETYALIPFLY